MVGEGEGQEGEEGTKSIAEEEEGKAEGVRMNGDVGTRPCVVDGDRDGGGRASLKGGNEEGPRRKKKPERDKTGSSRMVEESEVRKVKGEARNVRHVREEGEAHKDGAKRKKRKRRQEEEGGLGDVQHQNGWVGGDVTREKVQGGDKEEGEGGKEGKKRKRRRKKELAADVKEETV